MIQLARYTRGTLVFLLPLLAILQGCSRERVISTASAEARAAYDEGVDAWTKFYYVEAEHAFRRALAADSGFALAWARLAMLAYVTDEEEQARKAIDHALALAPSASRHEQLLIRAWDRRVRFDGAAALRTVDTLLREFDDDAEAHVLRGELLELQRDVDGAIASYTRAVTVDSNCARASMMLGYAYSTLNRQEEALAWMRRYIRLVPGAADPRASYADLLFRVGRYDEALAQYRASLAEKPDYWYSFSQIGGIYQVLGRLREAREQIRRGMEGLPPGPSREAGMKVIDGNLASLRAEYADAADLFGEALAVDSTSVSAASGLAAALVRLKNFRGAEKIIRGIGEEFERRNLGTTAWMFRLHLAWANLYLEEERLDSAEAACEEAIELSSPLTRPSASRILAEVFLRRGEYERALDACEDALGMNPNYPWTLLTLARVYRAKGDAVMTREITARLQELWKDADPDFRELRSLEELRRAFPRAI